MASLIVVEDIVGPASLGRGGHCMYVLQWLHALERLGHRVLFVDFLEEDPGSQREPAARYFGDTVERWWHPERSALLLERPTESLYGQSTEEVARAAGEAAAIITLAAHYRGDPYPYLEGIRPRVLIETDPAYTHLWGSDGDAAEIFGEHDLYFTVGGNVGSTRCAVPTLDLEWRPIWNPVVLDWWAADAGLTRDRFTTVADWRSYGYLEFGGQVLGPKAEEFRKFIDLPRRAGETIELALTIDAQDPDRSLLEEHGWRIESPERVADAGLYREYVAGSIGEFSCAKGGYVGTHCGWFSDRSACYLAAGRPVVLQATGFEELLPTGRGLFAVRTVGEAVEAIRAIRQDYRLHSTAAREIAQAHFASDRIAGRLLAEAGV